MLCSSKWWRGQLHQPGPFADEHHVENRSPRAPAGTAIRWGLPGSVPCPVFACTSRTPAENSVK